MVHPDMREAEAALYVRRRMRSRTSRAATGSVVILTMSGTNKISRSTGKIRSSQFLNFCFLLIFGPFLLVMKISRREREVDGARYRVWRGRQIENGRRLRCYFHPKSFAGRYHGDGVSNLWPSKSRRL